MTYHLGVDLGTTYTAAAVHRHGRLEIVDLGLRTTVVPSVLLVKEDGSVLAGDAANRRAVYEPDRVAREFKRRIGDSAPIMVGGSPLSPQALSARLVRWVVDNVGQREGGPGERVCLTHPANWGPFKLELLHETLHVAGLDDAVTLTEPEAAAAHYQTQERLDPGQVVAVYDLGGGTFDATVLRKTETAFEILGQPHGIEHLGGIDFDAAMFSHVRDALEGALDDLDLDDPVARSGLAQLRQQCLEAKESLSSDTDATIPVALPNVRTEIRITRTEFEDMIRPALTDTIQSLRKTIHSAEVEPDDVSAVLLVGGSSRIPLVAQMVGAELGRPVAVDTHPKHGVALGAALFAAQAPPAPALHVDAGVDESEPGRVTAPPPAAAAPTPPPDGPTSTPPAPPPPATIPTPAPPEPAPVHQPVPEPASGRRPGRERWIRANPEAYGFSSVAASPGRRAAAWALDLVIAFATLYIGWLIWALLKTWREGQSPGKSLLGLRVVSIDTDRPPSPGRMFVRDTLLRDLLGVFTAGIFWGAGAVGVSRPARQAVWDASMRTVVVDDRDGRYAPEHP